MKEFKVNGVSYYSNIKDYERLAKCINFFSDGCTSYAISFDNQKESIIQTINLEGIYVHYLRKMNFEQCFLPQRAKDLKESKEVLQKGLDLIEIL